MMVIGWPETEMGNIYHYMQYAVGVLAARVRYGVPQFAAVVISDPARSAGLRVRAL